MEDMFGNSQGNVRYVQVVDGKFAIKVTEEEARDASGNLKPSYRKRTNKKGVEVYEFTADFIEGTLDRKIRNQSNRRRS